MKEDFLHFIWRTRRFDAANLTTTDGQPIEILQPGEYNTHAGPDFFNARLRIGPTEWAGNVEMHVHASEWIAHGHSDDLAYDSVILHVVWENDLPICHRSGATIPCLVLQSRVAEPLLLTYEHLMHDATWISCSGSFQQAPSILIRNWMDRLLVERLEQKTDHIAVHLASTNNHWEEAFYRALAASFGLKVNQEPFEALARSLPLVILAKHKNDLLQLEALLFGQAGLLEEPFKESYPALLAKEYRFLRHKYGLTPLAGSQWKFLRLRPANFPTVRIAQFAALIYQSSHLFAQITEAETVREVEHLFALQVNGYWSMHYRFDTLSHKRNKSLGRDFIHLLIINTIIPALFHYGRSRQSPRYETKALRWLEELAPEQNIVITGWETMGLKPRHAYETQALLHLKKHYCDKKRCLECTIGAFLIK